MGCFKIVEGFVKYRVGRRVRSDNRVVAFRLPILNINVVSQQAYRKVGGVADWQLKQSRNSPTHTFLADSALPSAFTRRRFQINNTTFI